MENQSQIEVASWKLERPPTGIGFSPDGRFLHAYDGRTIYTWSVQGFEVRRFSIDEAERSREGHCRFLNGGESIMLIASDDNSEEGFIMSLFVIWKAKHSRSKRTSASSIMD